MVYDWDKHEQLCYRLYIDERKSLEEIMDHLRVHHKFAPSKRAYQTQFRRWDFPSKQNPAHKNDRLVARVKELWERNLSQREMLRVLNEEDGFDIKQRELMRVRSRNRWLLRMPNAEKSAVPIPVSPIGASAAAAASQSDMSMRLGAIASVTQEDLNGAQASENELTPQVIAKRRDRLQKLEVVSAERWETRKRRRRTRGWAGLPADPPGPPRFPSETTIDESKAILSLDNELYRELRTRFGRICDEAGVSKKTIAGPERWEGVKTRLIQESPHLQNVMWADQENVDGRKLALDVICTDVTKRMRTMHTKMTVAEAKNTLGVNPEQSRTMRQEFLAILKADHFTSKIEAGHEHWAELKERWLRSSSILQGVLAAGATDPSHEEKVRAADVLARDVMKRLRDDQARRDPNRNKTSSHFAPVSPNNDMMHQQPHESSIDPSVNPGHDDQLQDNYGQAQQTSSQLRHMNTGLGPGTPNRHNGQNNPGPPQLPLQTHIQSPSRDLSHNHALQSLSNGQALAHSPSHNQPQLLPNGLLDNGLPIDPQIDGALPVLMNGHDTVNSQHAHAAYIPQTLAPQGQQHAYVTQHFASTVNPTPQPPPIAVYLRLHPSSPITMAPSIWIATLTARTFEELRQVAVKDLAGTVCGRVEGILAEGMTINISRDDELTAYLAVVEGRGGSGAPGFYIQVLGAGWKT
ncbi:uncharacterized protein BCR38DRAFT_79413 [Pseudomassariella vexata]|uniref:Uncharacterized protein n=1 Tax=Pseudomassariella vexata TaxID=1141098 RepID=A0A1Y2DGB7_9PEZI|nr:uncharacterized protein BCR38DRAFT_79413 [Pseudomassariella vexata]ORY57735.1 hypothetical protein BCR38DRAFT_79413 [Pseudomassariella vexata]